MEALGKEEHDEGNEALALAYDLGTLVEYLLDMIGCNGNLALEAEDTVSVREVLVVINNADYGIVHKSVGNSVGNRVSNLDAVLDSCLEVLSVLLYLSDYVVGIVLGKINELLNEIVIEDCTEVNALKKRDEVIVGEALNKSVYVVTGSHKRAEYLLLKSRIDGLGVSRLENSLGEELRNLHLKYYGTVDKVKVEVSAKKCSSRAYVVRVLFRNLKSESEVGGSTEGSINSDGVGEFHILGLHISDVAKAGNGKDKLLDACKVNSRTVLGYSVNGNAVDGNVFNNSEKLLCKT